jgi:hypothetical protein
MHLIERYRRIDKDTLKVDMTLTDPKTYTKPWVADTITFVSAKVAIFEEICSPSEERRFNDDIRDESKAITKP